MVDRTLVQCLAPPLPIQPPMAAPPTVPNALPPVSKAPATPPTAAPVAAFCCLCVMPAQPVNVNKPAMMAATKVLPVGVFLMRTLLNAKSQDDIRGALACL